MLDSYKDVLSVDEVGDILGVSRKMVYRLIQSKELRSKRIGRIHRICKDDVIQYLQ